MRFSNSQLFKHRTKQYVYFSFTCTFSRPRLHPLGNIYAVFGKYNVNGKQIFTPPPPHIVFCFRVCAVFRFRIRWRMQRWQSPGLKCRRQRVTGQNVGNGGQDYVRVGLGLCSKGGQDYVQVGLGLWSKWGQDYAEVGLGLCSKGGQDYGKSGVRIMLKPPNLGQILYHKVHSIKLGRIFHRVELGRASYTWEFYLELKTVINSCSSDRYIHSLGVGF